MSAPGDQIGGYVLRRQIGSGGMGAVWEATTAEGRGVALKLLHPGFCADPDARARFSREVANLQRLRSDRVARVLDADLEGERAFIVTELIDGLSLADSVAAEEAFHPLDLAPLARGLHEAIAHVHSAGLLHRDIKPGNVMLTYSGPVLIDFGIAQVVDDDRLTHTGFVTGTPGYLDPTALSGAAIGAEGDWFGWTAVLLLAATGRAPFGRGGMDAVLARLSTGRPDVEGLPDGLAASFWLALHPDPQRRMPPADLLARLDAYAEGEDLPAPSAAAAGLADASLADPAIGGEATRVVAPPPPPPGAAPFEAAAGGGADVRGQAPPPPPRDTAQAQAPRSPARDSVAATRTMPWQPTSAAAPGSPPGSPTTPLPPLAGRDRADRHVEQSGAGLGGGVRGVGAGGGLEDAGAPQPPVPAWAMPPRPRPGMVMLSGLLVLAVAIAWPGIAVIAVSAGFVLATAAGMVERRTRRRRLAAGKRRSDSFVATAWSLPLLLAAVPMALLPLLVGALAGAAVLWLGAQLAGPDDLAGIEGLARVTGSAAWAALLPPAALAAALLAAWWVPIAEVTRHGARAAWRAVAPSGGATRTWVAILLAVTLAVGITGWFLPVDWAPLPAPALLQGTGIPVG
ncbi:serine/threonine-protein kinase [Serinibacter salmoneus]|uniref:non-specific serine/threonine protein kinase n=1 Tax=Serinibacter salmoneus TaxID=556530 RepID=A0A2A9D1J6_9MICO|nr:serine/threonine-protein kinase [Serinibacter salmoneus]PFG20588.1 serine/threonine protein kinase [Serinibacter salmoneus]